MSTGCCDELAAIIEEHDSPERTRSMRNLRSRLQQIEQVVDQESLTVVLTDGRTVRLDAGADLDIAFALMVEGEAVDPDLCRIFADSVPQPDEGTITAMVRQECRKLLDHGLPLTSGKTKRRARHNG